MPAEFKEKLNELEEMYREAYQYGEDQYDRAEILEAEVEKFEDKIKKLKGRLMVEGQAFD